MSDLLFEVVGRSKTEKKTKEGNLETTYKVTLQTPNKKYKLTIIDSNSALLMKYPLNSDVPVNVGKSDQVALVSEEQLRQEIKKAERSANAEAENSAKK